VTPVAKRPGILHFGDNLAVLEGMPAESVDLICRLWKKQSASGQMGGLRVLVMANKDPQGEDAHTHVLLITAADSGGAVPATTERPSDGAAGRTQTKIVRPSSHPPGRAARISNARVRIADDPVPW
jgi:hypothetical protein